MGWVRSAQEVFDAMSWVKAHGITFCTNIYPTQEKIEGWIAHNQLRAVRCGDSAFFLRRDRDFWRLDFCAPDADALRRDLGALRQLQTERVVSELVGKAETLDALLPALESAGLRRYKCLARMVRTAWKGTPAAPGDGVVLPDKRDAPSILGLIEATFDRFAEQIPTQEEIEAAIYSRQILTLRCGEALAGLLYYETRGVTSTLRYWVVAPAFQGRSVGAALMRHYLATQEQVRRFVLWVDSDNQNAISKYGHYHYATDGVVDHVLANEWIAQ